MKYNFQLTYQDFKHAQKLHREPTRRFKVLIIIAAIVVLPVFGILYEMLLEGEDGWMFWMMAGLLGWFLLAWFVIIPLRWKRIYKQHKLFQKAATYNFSEEFFSAESEFGAGQVPWNQFHKWKEGEHCFLIYQSDMLFQLIPKRIFGNPEEVARLRSILEKSILKKVR